MSARLRPGPPAERPGRWSWPGTSHRCASEVTGGGERGRWGWGENAHGGLNGDLKNSLPQPVLTQRGLLILTVRAWNPTRSKGSFKPGSS